MTGGSLTGVPVASHAASKGTHKTGGSPAVTIAARMDQPPQAPLRDAFGSDGQPRQALA
jgi:hypothetical protein